MLPAVMRTSARTPFLRSALAFALVLAWPIGMVGCAQRGARGPVRVLAAASFTDVLGTIARRFEAAHPGTTTELAFGGSQELRLQLANGAEADVFVSANRAHVDSLARAGRVKDTAVLACNGLAIVTTSGNPHHVTGLADLANAPRLVLGIESSPIGGYTTEALGKLAARDGAAARDRILARVVSRELDVRQVLAKVRLGEADAAIVYRTDALAARASVTPVPIEPGLDVEARSFVATVEPPAHAETARAFRTFLRGEEATKDLHDAGFQECRAP